MAVLRGGRAAVASCEGGAGVAGEGLEGERGLRGLVGVGVVVRVGGRRRGSLLPLHRRGGERFGSFGVWFSFSFSSFFFGAGGCPRIYVLPFFFSLVLSNSPEPTLLPRAHVQCKNCRFRFLYCKFDSAPTLLPGVHALVPKTVALDFRAINLI